MRLVDLSSPHEGRHFDPTVVDAYVMIFTEQRFRLEE